MTPLQRKHIRTGTRRIMEAANRAYAAYVHDCTDIGSAWSKRDVRSFRGRVVTEGQPPTD